MALCLYTNVIVLPHTLYEGIMSIRW